MKGKKNRFYTPWTLPPLTFIFSRGGRENVVGGWRGVRGLLLRPEKQWTRFFRGDRYFRGVLTLGQQRTLYKIGTTELSLFYSGFPMKTPEFKDSPFLSISRKSQSSNACAMLYACVQWHIRQAHGIFFCGGRGEFQRLWVRTNTKYNTLKVRTKDAHIICGGPTLKDVELFERTGLRTLREMSLWLKIYW